MYNIIIVSVSNCCCGCNYWGFPLRTEDTLGELLKEIEAHSGTVKFEAMANIIAVHSQAEGRQNNY